MATEALPLEGVIGFGGTVKGGLLLHPDGCTLIYPLGSTIVIREKGMPTSQEFMQGHSDTVSCMTLSRSGRYLASGQITYMGFCADIIIWDLQTRTLLHRMSLHKVKVQALAFSHDEQFLASMCPGRQQSRGVGCVIRQGDLWKPHRERERADRQVFQHDDHQNCNRGKPKYGRMGVRRT